MDLIPAVGSGKLRVGSGGIPNSGDICDPGSSGYVAKALHVESGHTQSSLGSSETTAALQCCGGCSGVACSAVQYCAVPCRAMSCRAVLYCSVLCYAVLLLIPICCVPGCEFILSGC